MKKTLNLFQKFNYISNHIIAKRMRKLLANPTKNTFNMQNMVIVIYIYVKMQKIMQKMLIEYICRAAELVQKHAFR